METNVGLRKEPPTGQNIPGSPRVTKRVKVASCTTTTQRRLTSLRIEVKGRGGTSYNERHGESGSTHFTNPTRDSMWFVVFATAAPF